MAHEVDNHSEFIKTKPDMGKVVNEDSTLTKFQEDIAAARPGDRNFPIPFPEPSPRPPRPFREEELSPLKSLNFESIDQLLRQKDENNSSHEKRHIKPRIADTEKDSPKLNESNAANPKSSEADLGTKQSGAAESPSRAADSNSEGMEAVRGAMRGAESGAIIGLEKSKSLKEKFLHQSEHLIKAIDSGAGKAAKEFFKKF